MREFAPQLHAIHPTDAMEADEEIVFLADAFLSHVPEASCSVPAYRAWLNEQDFTRTVEYHSADTQGRARICRTSHRLT